MAHHVYGIRAASGAWERTIGAEGSGPGEFERPFGLAVLADSVVVGNSGRATLEIFSAGGEYGRSIRLGAMGFSVRLLTELQSVSYDPQAQRYVVLEQMPVDLGGGPATVHFFDSSGVYLAAKRFPNSWVGVDMRGSRLYALVQDSTTGLVRFIAYSVTIPPLSM